MTRTPIACGVAAALLLGTSSSAIFAQEMTRERVAVAITETIAGHNPYGDAVVLVGSLWCKVYGSRPSTWCNYPDGLRA